MVSGQNPTGQNLTGQNPYGQNPTRQNPAGQNPTTLKVDKIPQYEWWRKFQQFGSPQWQCVHM